MEKSATMNLRVNPGVKQQAEDVLRQLGIPMATAIDIYLRQISLTGGIPFTVSLPKPSSSPNADDMIVEEFHAQLMTGYGDMRAGNMHDAAEAFAKFKESRREEDLAVAEWLLAAERLRLEGTRSYEVDEFENSMREAIKKETKRDA